MNSNTTNEAFTDLWSLSRDDVKRALSEDARYPVWNGVQRQVYERVREQVYEHVFHEAVKEFKP
jgi:hypothetical protein